jgi:AAA domain
MSEQEKALQKGLARVDESGDVVGVRPTSWRPIDLGPVLRGEKRPLEPELLAREDGKCLLYPGAPHVAFGESETLKSYFAMLGAKAFLDAGHRVLYIDFESNDVTFVQHARQVGIVEGFIGSSLVYMRPEEPLYYLQRDGTLKPDEDAVFQLEWARQELKPAFIVVDGVTEAYALHGWNINDGAHAAHFQRVFGRWEDGTASLAIDHSGKDASRGQIGSQHKRAGIDGAQYEFTKKQRQGIGGHSIAEIRVTKDRPGAVRGFAPDGRIGTIHVTDDAVWIEEPGAPDLSGNAKLQLRQAILDFLDVNPGSSGAKVVDSVPGRAAAIRQELKDMEASGVVWSAPGPRNSTLWTLSPVPAPASS